MASALTGGGATGGDDSETLALEFHMNDEQEVPALVHADQGIPGFFLRACVDDSKERVEECLGGEDTHWPSECPAAAR